MTGPVASLTVRQYAFPLLFGLLSCAVMATGEDVVLLVLSIFIWAAVALILLKQTGGFIVTPALLFYLFFTLFIYIMGMGFFLQNGEGAIWNSGVRNYRFYMVLNGGMISLAMGVMLASALTEFRAKTELGLFRAKPWYDSFDLPSDNLALFAVAGGAILVTGIYVFVVQGGSVPLITVLLAGERTDVQELAFAARAEFSRYGRGAGQYAYQGYLQQFYIIILPALSLLAGARYLHGRKPLALAAWLFLLLASGFFLIMSLQRWPLMFFIILNYILFTTYHGRIRVRNAIYFLLLIIGMFATITYMRGIDSLASVLIAVRARIFVVNVDVFYSIIEMFPRHYAHWGGRAIWSDLVGVLPGPGIGFARWLFDHLYGVYGNGTAPTIFWGEMYADFGLPGVWLGALISGIVMQAIYITFIRSRKSLTGLVLYVIFTMAMAELALTNPVVVIFQYGIVTVLLLLLLLNTLRWLLYAGPFPVVPGQLARSGLKA